MRSGDGDFRTRHAGCPIISGTKWGEQNNIYACSVNMDETKRAKWILHKPLKT